MSLLDSLKLPTPIQLLDSNFLNKRVKLLIKRDDLIHPWINGNKWRKLQGHLDHYGANEYSGIITYGGANSNHLVAVACACYHLDIPSVGIVRSYQLDESNPIIRKLRSWNMVLKPVLPVEYQQKETSSIIRHMLSDYPNHMLIAEGGTSEYAMAGLRDLSHEIVSDPLYERDIDILLPIGTGGMLAGLYHAMPNTHQFFVASPFKSEVSYVEGLSLLKNMNVDRIQFLNASGGKRFGAYDSRSVNVINEFYSKYGVLLDPIYTAKAIQWLMDQLTIDDQMSGRSVLLIHSGGLPGIMAYNYMYQSKRLLVTVPPEYNHLQYAATTLGKK